MKQAIDKILNQFKKEIPHFKAGDTLKVKVKIVERITQKDVQDAIKKSKALQKPKERWQLFEGICIARHNNSLNSTFTVRKLSCGEHYVERVFPLHSPNIKIEVAREGVVRRAKLYFLRDRKGKAARIRTKSAKVSS